MDVEFWVEKYCSKGSWTKALNFPYSIYDFEHFLCISKGNEFTSENGEGIIRFQKAINFIKIKQHSD